MERKTREQSDRTRGAILTGDRMLAVDFSDVLSDRTRQVIIGWMRHAFEQSCVIAQLHLAGMGHAAAPNRRSFFETLGRLLWLEDVDQADRAGTVDAMIADDKKHIVKEVTNLRDLGYESDAKLEEMESLILDVTPVGRIEEEARNFFHALKSTRSATAGLYKAWRQATQYTHATALLGAAYAPNQSDRIGSGRPPEPDPELETHIMAMMLVMTMTVRLLDDEGVPKAKTKELVEAYLV